MRPCRPQLRPESVNQKGPSGAPKERERMKMKSSDLGDLAQAKSRLWVFLGEAEIGEDAYERLERCYREMSEVWRELVIEDGEEEDVV